jgi:formylmethanofuran dehydrogenase subunit B
LCDDVTVETTGDGVRLRPECPLGARWFSERMRRAEHTPATIDGAATDVESALARAAEVLRGARRPRLCGFENATVEDARAAFALADRLGALVELRDGEWPGVPAVPLRGASTATLGEIRDRSKLVIVWREDPETTHPRLLGRLGLAREGRTLVVIDDADTPTAARADVRLKWPREHDLTALTSLHVLERGLEVRSDDLVGLIERLHDVPHVAFIYGAGLTAGPGGQRRALALHELVRAVNHERHAVTLELPEAPGTRSADDVLAWQSGYGGNVDFAGGHPEWVMATELSRDGEVTVRVESGPTGSLVAGPGVEVWIRTAAAGVGAGGTVHRLDGVPLTLQAPQPDDAPTAAAVLAGLLERVQR